MVSVRYGWLSLRLKDFGGCRLNLVQLWISIFSVFSNGKMRGKVGEWWSIVNWQIGSWEADRIPVMCIFVQPLYYPPSSVLQSIYD